MSAHVKLIPGCHVKLADGRIRGPMVCSQTSVFKDFRLESTAADRDLQDFWTVSGTYCAAPGNANDGRHVVKVLTAVEAESLKLGGGLIADSLLVEVDQERLSTLLLNRSERDWLRKLIARGMAAEVGVSPEPAKPVEPAKPQPRTAFEIKPLFEAWLDDRLRRKNGKLVTTGDAFLAGYNAALRYESGLGIRPFEKAQGGLSESEKLQPIPTPEELADAMLKSIGKSFETVGGHVKDLWLTMAKTAIEQLRGPITEPTTKPYSTGNHPAHIEADLAREADIQDMI